MLQRFLLRTHTEDRVWPHFDLSRALIQLLQQKNPAAASKLVELCGKDLVWMPTAGQSGQYAKNVKEDVANAPVLAGLASQLLPAESPWWTGTQLAQLRQIRNFDPAWFELGCRTGLLLALVVEQKLAPQRQPTASGHSTTSTTRLDRSLTASPVIRRVPRQTGDA
jgi:hypothetical protein